MPNRVIREGLIDSDRMNAVDEASALLFIHLLVLADDAGRYDGRISIITAKAFPLRRDIDEREVKRRVSVLVAQDLIRFYAHDGKPYLVIPRFNQRLRIMRSKFPAPPDDMTDICRLESESETESETEKRERRARDGAGPDSKTRPGSETEDDRRSDGKTRIDPDLRLDSELRAQARWAGLPDSHDIEGEFAKFKDHYLGNGSRRDYWPATWRNWCRRAVGEFAPSRGPATDRAARRTERAGTIDGNRRAIVARMGVKSTW